MRTLSFVSCVWVLCFTASAQFLSITNPAPQVALAWDASTDPAVTGYRVYYGIGSRQYTNMTPAGASTTVTLTLPARGMVFYFAATCVNSAGLESDFSAEVTYTPPAMPSPPINVRATNAVLKVSMEYAPTPTGPWSPFATLATTTGLTGFYRSTIAINPPAPPAVIPKKVLRSPKASS